MARKLLRGARLVLASHNPGKLAEVEALVRPFGFDVLAAGTLGLAEPGEDAPDFAGNAAIKALSAARTSGLPALADDSGFCVAALGGAPGVHSARWAGPGKDFASAMARVNALLERRPSPPPLAGGGWGEGSNTQGGCFAFDSNHPERAPGDPTDRRAWFTAALCLAWPDGYTATFLGRVDGEAIWPPRGENGFGYDPMFLPGGASRTFGELDPAQKHTLSHRARAFAQLQASCFQR
jgi:XTP/dITP diphosphohydrolase